MILTEGGQLQVGGNVSGWINPPHILDIREGIALKLKTYVDALGGILPAQ